MNQEPLLRSIKAHLCSVLSLPDAPLRIARLVARLDAFIPVCPDPDIRLKMSGWRVRLEESLSDGTARDCASELVSEVIGCMQPALLDEYLCAVLDYRYDRHANWESLVKTVSAAAQEGRILEIDPPWADPSVQVIFGVFDSDPTKAVYLIGCTNPYFRYDSIENICRVNPTQAVHIFNLKTRTGTELMACMGESAETALVAASVIREILRRID